jgi:hypothetical protein
MSWLALVDKNTSPLLAAVALLASGKPALPAKDGVGTPLPPAEAALLLVLLSGLGEDVPQALWASSFAPPHQAAVPSAALWLDQQRAVTEKRVGETVLTSLILARNGDRLTGEPIVLARIVAGLKLIGLDREARALAVEAALDAGL